MKIAVQFATAYGCVHAMATVELWQSAVETHLFKNHPHKMLEEIVRLCVILC